MLGSLVKKTTTKPHLSLPNAWPSFNRWNDGSGLSDEATVSWEVSSGPWVPARASCAYHTMRPASWATQTSFLLFHRKILHILKKHNPVHLGFFLSKFNVAILLCHYSYDVIFSFIQYIFQEDQPHSSLCQVLGAEQEQDRHVLVFAKLTVWHGIWSLSK